MGRKMVLTLFVILSVVTARQNGTMHSQSLSVSMPGVPAFLQKEDPCTCSYKGKCSCEGAIEFMTCIQEKCQLGGCKCLQDGKNHFMKSCLSMSTSCPDLGLECSEDTATCNGESVGLSEEGESSTPEGSEGLRDQDASKVQESEEETDSSQEAKTESSESEDEAKTSQEVKTEFSQPSRYIKKDGNKYVSHSHYKKHVTELHSHVHHVFAKGIVAGIVVLSLTLALATSGNGTIEKNTWSTMDMVIVTFLALAWFYVTMHLLEFHKLSGWTKVLTHGGIAVFLLFVSSMVTWIMHKKHGEEGVIIFSAIFNNVLLWCFAGFVSNVQQMFKHSSFLVLLSTVGLAVCYALLALFWYYVVGEIEDKEWSSDSINMLTGAALAAGVVLWVHMIVAGGYHTVEEPRPTKPSLGEAIFMNCFSVVYLVVALKFGPILQRLSDNCNPKEGTNALSDNLQIRTYWKKRAIDSFAVFVSFLPYYSFVLSLGHLILDNLGFEAGSTEARLYLALLSTGVGMGLIVLCAKLRIIARNAVLSDTLIGLGGFMTGTAWANLLNNAINMVAEGATHPFRLKLEITCFLTAVVFPVYFYYIKPIVMQKTGVKL